MKRLADFLILQASMKSDGFEELKVDTIKALDAHAVSRFEVDYEAFKGSKTNFI
ncbi:hypothetical protein [Vibrio hyugaensis]|uniref:hypothetical protein n=1 Tax=Vibrio hyugaensis TaxID=1534743 RepID=UPI000AD6A858|nr:hypothetical protein [Vibrio hyugaensis]